MLRGAGIVGCRQSGDKSHTDLHQGLPRIETCIAPRCSNAVSPSDRHLVSADDFIRICILHHFGVIGCDDIHDFLSRRHGLALTHAPGDVFHVLHEAVKARAAERNLAAAAVENSRRQGAFERQHREHPLLDGAFGHKIDDPHRPCLAHAMNARDALFEDRRVPRQVHVHQGRRVLQIEACAARIGGQEHAARGVVTKPLDQCRPFVRWHAAMEADIAQLARFETADDDVVGSSPLREHHRLGLGVGEQVVEQRRQFVSLDAMVGFLVQQIGAVARHAHVLQGTGQPPLIDLRQKPGLAPALDDFRYGIGVFLMIEHLHLGHRYQQILVCPAGKLPQHFGFTPANHHRGQSLADLLQPGVPGDAAGFVLDLMLVQQLPGWPQPVLIDELDDGNQFFQLVFQRRPGQHDRIGTIDLF